MDELIYNQTMIPKEKWRYGFRTSSATGCGWIATYNALRILGSNPEPEELIRRYERQLPLIHGNAGTSFWGPALLLRQMGFEVNMVFDPAKMDKEASAAPVSILFFHWRKQWKLGAHFVAVRYEDGRFIGYNTFRNSTGPDLYGPSLSAFLKKHRYFGPVLITVRK